jgi:cytidylate kinase
VIAIDGPSGVGKGTVSRALAEALGYRHIDTGAMYRAVGWAARARALPIDDEIAVAALAGQVPMSLEGGAVVVDGVARRRAADPAHGGSARALSDVASALAARDKSDSTRTASPLSVAADAVVIDTTGTPVDEVVQRALAVVLEKW